MPELIAGMPVDLNPQISDVHPYVFAAPGTIYIDDDICPVMVQKIALYMRDELLPHMEEGLKESAYFVMDGCRWGCGPNWTLVDEPDGHFWKEILREGTVRKDAKYSVRKLVLGENGQLLSTPQYVKEFNQLAGDWPEMALDALEPGPDPILVKPFLYKTFCPNASR